MNQRGGIAVLAIVALSVVVTIGSLLLTHVLNFQHKCPEATPVAVIKVR